MGIDVDIDDGLMIGAVGHIGDGSGGLLGEGNPVITEHNSNIKRMMKALCNIFVDVDNN